MVRKLSNVERVIKLRKTALLQEYRIAKCSPSCNVITTGNLSYLFLMATIVVLIIALTVGQIKLLL